MATETAGDIFTEHDGMIGVTLDGGEVESQEELHTGNRVSKEGTYHVTATACELGKAVTDEGEEKNKLPRLEFELQILDGTGTDGKQLVDQVDKVIGHNIYLAGWKDKANGEMESLDEKKQKGIRAFAYAFGLIADADLAKKGLSIPFHMIVGRQAVVKVQREKDWTNNKGQRQKGSLKISWNNDAWPVDNDFVKDIHKNREALALLAGVGVATGAASDADLNDI